MSVPRENTNPPESQLPALSAALQVMALHVLI